MKKHELDLNRVEFYSKEDMAGGHYLAMAEPILKSEIKSVYEDINDVLELYNIKKYFDNKLYLKSWTQDDVDNFKKKVSGYAGIIGQFISKINNENFISYYEQLFYGYIDSFWELLNNQNGYKRISAEKIMTVLSKEPHEIRNILTYKNLVTYYNTTLRDFLLTYPKSAELLLSIYEERKDFHNEEMYLPKSLTMQDKEDIISNYLDSDDANLNYIQLIENSKKHNEFTISDKTRLKAKRKEKKETEKIFKDRDNSSFKYGMSVCFAENVTEIKEAKSENLDINYSYSLDFIKQNSDNYFLYLNFKKLFEYLDIQNRINLVSKKSQMGLMENILGLHSKNEYQTGITFNLSEMTSYAQIVGYNKVINDLGDSLENVLQFIFTSTFQEKYNFASNARLLMPNENISCFEKVRLLAPEFESVLKQYKLFVEDNEIDFDLLQISSSPCAIKDIPSLIPNKYIYLNEDNKEIVGCSNLFFSDQTMLAYVEPYKEKHYHTFFNLLRNEQVNFNNYEDYQKPKIGYLIEKGLIIIDEKGFIKVANPARLFILKDLYNNEVSSFYYYPVVFQKEAMQMAEQNMIFFESSLFSRSEQSYFNYFLNKSEFTNGLDLRNSYLHGTQANPKETKRHEFVYFTYLKLLVLVLLKMEDDLHISQVITNYTNSKNKYSNDERARTR
jgi:hypothetical protein